MLKKTKSWKQLAEIKSLLLIIF